MPAQLNSYRGFLLIFSLLAAACDRSAPTAKINGLTMGTGYRVEWVGAPEKINISQIKELIDQRLKKINALMSTYDPDSQLSQFNRSRRTGWHAVDKELAQLVKQALLISRQTAGAFDITVGPLVNLWGFGPHQSEFQLPAEAEIDAALGRVGYQHLQARLAPAALNKKRADLYVDLSAIAKGYGVDEVAKILDSFAIENYMVEIGGEVKAMGAAAHGNAWRIGIETPAAQNNIRGNTGGRNIQAVIALNNAGIATSGNYRNFFRYAGKQYSHTIDPRTGYPVKHNLGSVTVINTSTALADAWATAFIVLGAEQAFSLSGTMNLAVLLITREQAGYKSTPNQAMRAFLIQ